MRAVSYHVAMSFRSRIADAVTRRAGGRAPAPEGGLGSFGDLGPGPSVVAEWRQAGLQLPDVLAMRRYRLERLRGELRRLGYSGALLGDPINVRYATDSTNMQLWTMHNLVRFVFVASEGPVVLFDFHGSDHLSAHLELVDEVRHGQSWSFFDTGTRRFEAARAWAVEVASLVAEHGRGERRLAIDVLDPVGTEALTAAGIALGDGQQVCEMARVIKSPDEIAAIRCAVHTAEQAMAAMRAALRPGMSEQELWSHLHAESIRRGSEWIETRLLSSGPRTNPWFQECSSRVVQAGDVVAFDTDMIGPYGYCADISRTWMAGDVPPTDRQRTMYRLAVEQIEHNLALLRPGLGFLEFAERAFALPQPYRANRYSVVLHGVGLCDEYPAIYYPEDAAFAYDGVFEAGMTLCLESYIGDRGGPDGVKLEQQVLLTESGAELLSTYPLEPALLDP
jgi:Xaa-Pro dipeptidase